jgi:hypothetical protein
VALIPAEHIAGVLAAIGSKWRQIAEGRFQHLFARG